MMMLMSTPLPGAEWTTALVHASVMMTARSSRHSVVVAVADNSTVSTAREHATVDLWRGNDRFIVRFTVAPHHGRNGDGETAATNVRPLPPRNVRLAIRTTT